jgi:hypothetical protein
MRVWTGRRRRVTFLGQAEQFAHPPIANDDLPLDIDHAKAVRHIVEGRVEAAGEQAHVPTGITASSSTRRSRSEMIQGGEEGNENRGENGVVPATDEQQCRRRGDAGADNLCQHQEVTGEIAPRDADHVGQRRQGEAENLHKRIGGLGEGNETPHAEQT